MKLLLTSSGLSNQSITNALIKLFDGNIHMANIVYIDTAAIPEIGHDIWSNTDKGKFIDLEPKSFESIDISQMETSDIHAKFRSADIFVFGGGNTAFLAYWLHRHNLAEYLRKFDDKKIYVGISAGSQVTTHKLHLVDWGDLYEEAVENDIPTGLGLVDFDIFPHLNSEWFRNIREENVKKYAYKVVNKTYAIDDESALIVNGQKVSVVSEGTWLEFI